MIKKIIIIGAFMLMPLMALASVAGGTVTVGTVSAGQSPTYIITPDHGYQIQDVQVDGVSVGPVSTYTFTNISANHTISATFSPVTPTTTTDITAQIKILIGQLTISLQNDINALQAQITAIQAKITIFNNINSNL